jgi:hypothetical protein
MSGVITIHCGSVLLADGTNAGGRVESLTLNGRRVIDVAAPLRASDVVIFGRGNRRKEIAFRIITQAGGMADSLAAMFIKDDGLPDQADLVLTLDDGVDVATITLPAAGWESVKPQANGLSWTCDYSVVAGVANVMINDAVVTPSWPLQLLSESLIDPLIIPANTVADSPAGWLLVCRALECDGELDVEGELAVIGEA